MVQVRKVALEPVLEVHLYVGRGTDALGGGGVGARTDGDWGWLMGITVLVVWVSWDWTVECRDSSGLWVVTGWGSSRFQQSGSPSCAGGAIRWVQLRGARL